MNDTPEFIRVKRRRDEDSVQALIFDENQKRKKARYVFKLTRTVNQDVYANKESTTTPLLKLSEEADNKHFVLEQHNRHGDSNNIEDINSRNIESCEDSSESLPDEIAQMVNDYLKIQKDSGEKPSRPKKPSKKHFSSEVAVLPSLDYVYDIYHLETIPEDEFDKYSTNDIGFIKIVNKDLDLIPESDGDSNFQLSDDEDSNDENYYQNDYPEDEDDDRSILFGSEVEDEESIDNLQWSKLPEEPHTSDETNNENFTSYSELFNRLEGSSNILNSLKNANVIDLDTATYNDYDAYENDDEEMNHTENYQETWDDHYEDEEYERNEFFPTDKDDPLAQYRDKIFGRLQKMINERTD